MYQQSLAAAFTEKAIFRHFETIAHILNIYQHLNIKKVQSFIY